jgi:hypothetical protein
MCTIFRDNAAFSFKKWKDILLENGTHVPKNVGETDLTFVLMSTATRLLGLLVRIPPGA